MPPVPQATFESTVFAGQTRSLAKLIVSKGTPGLRMLPKLGCRAAHTGEIVFEDCRVPADQLLGGDERLAERIAKGREAEGRSPPTPRRTSTSCGVPS